MFLERKIYFDRMFPLRKIFLSCMFPHRKIHIFTPALLKTYKKVQILQNLFNKFVYVIFFLYLCTRI